MANNIFLTGDIQVGKSTIISRLLKSNDIHYAGFNTLRYYEHAHLAGFYMESIGNRSTGNMISFIDNLMSMGPRVSRVRLRHVCPGLETLK